MPGRDGDFLQEADRRESLGDPGSGCHPAPGWTEDGTISSKAGEMDNQDTGTKEPENPSLAVHGAFAFRRSSKKGSCIEVTPRNCRAH